MSGYRLSKIYTRKGDDGTTSLDARSRISKDSIEIKTMGTLDELNSAIGLVLAFNPQNADVESALRSVQQELFNLGGELCPPHHPVITQEKVAQLETWLDEWNGTLPPLKEFIMPGGTPPAAACHLARAICRRAERCVVTLQSEKTMNPEILRYLNRLSDVLFVAARVMMKDVGGTEVLWEHER